MNNFDQNKQDQRTPSGMEDSTMMTIEFLTARLLSERTVLRTARQRADELAKRVAELEEQLRIVSLQRRKAERATADVLAILEGNGISDVSEAFDSSSDQDTPSEPKMHDRSPKEEGSVNSNVRNSESEEFSGSDLEFSPVPESSLSWKGRKDSSHSLENYKNSAVRRRSSITSVVSSPRQHSGKSCRQIRRKESRSVTEDHKTNHEKHDSPEDEVATTSENSPNGSNFEPKRREEKMVLEDSHSTCVRNEQNESNHDLDNNVYRRDRDMENALERQAQLIGQYEAMEKAQREWEEKFRENNNSTPDSCDHGNRSDITEERYEIRAPTRDPAVTIAFQTLKLKSEIEDASNHPNGILSSSHVQSNAFLLSSNIDASCSDDQKSNDTPVSGSSTHDFAFPMAKGKHNQENPGNNYHSLSHILPHDSASFASQFSTETQSLRNFPSNISSSNKGNVASGHVNESNAMAQHKTSDGVGSVLEALKGARQSLQQKIDRLPLVAPDVGKSIEPHVTMTIPGDKVQIPIGCVGLFRLPTDFLVEGNAPVDVLSSTTRFPDSYFDRGVLAPATNQLARSSYIGNTGDQFLSSQYVGGGSRVATPRPYIDPYMDSGLPSSSRQTYLSYPTNASYPNMMSPDREAFSASVPGRTVGISSSNHLSFSHNVRPNFH